MPICAILIPSRARPARLWKTIHSVRATSAPGAAEILVRFDDDDLASRAIVRDLEAADVRVLVGPRKRGYPSLSEFYTDLADVAVSPWIWVMNDDACIGGDAHRKHTGWDGQLAALPTEGFIVQPEIYQWGHSRYPFCEGGAFPAVPNRAWQRFGMSAIGSPIDTWLDELLRVTHGWKTRFLRDVEVIHDRDTDAVLAEHRKL